MRNNCCFFLQAKTQQRLLTGQIRSDQVTSSFCIPMSMIFAYTLHRHLFHLSLCIQRARGLPRVSWWGLAGIPVSTILLQQLNPPGPSCCLRLPPRCPADTKIAKFPWGGHFWQGAAMKPLLGSPWLSGCYLSPNSC